MKFLFEELRVITRRTVEVVHFARIATFIHGPVGTGKSTVARLISYCFGGDLERTPAIQSEFVTAQLFVRVGDNSVQFERGGSENFVRVTWEDGAGTMNSLNAPIEADEAPILGDDIFNLSDLMFFLAGTTPIKVRKSKRDPDSPLVRLSFRDLLWYCYLRQELLDSSFFRLEDLGRKAKSMDVMRFLTGLHSERLNELEAALVAAQDEQRAKRQAVEKIREFLTRFGVTSEAATRSRIQLARAKLEELKLQRKQVEREYTSSTHVLEPMREQLRQLSNQVEVERSALSDLEERIKEQQSVRAELVATKVKAGRAAAASSVLAGVEFDRCPRCGSSVERELQPQGACLLCHTPEKDSARMEPPNLELLRRDLDRRIDDLSDLLARHTREFERQRARADDALRRKARLDQLLADELSKYDSAYVANVRALDRRIVSLQARIRHLEETFKMISGLRDLEQEAGSLQGRIDVLRSDLADERARLWGVGRYIERIEDKFLAIMVNIGYPGVSANDSITLNPRSWIPRVVSGENEEIAWSFYDAGSGGKKTLFNVCYALAVHEVAMEYHLPLPTFLIIDSPTKNISRDINARLVEALYHYIYDLALRAQAQRPIQFLLIDSDLVNPSADMPEFSDRLMSDTDPEHPPLISYYKGP